MSTALKLPDGTVCRTGPTCRLHGDLHTLQEQVYAQFVAQAKKEEANLPEKLKTQRPDEVDTKLAELDYKRFEYVMNAHNAKLRLRDLNKKIEEASSPSSRQWDRRWLESGAPEKDKEYYERLITENRTKANAIQEQMAVYEAEYERRGGWTRAFFVANAGGHVHRSMNCSTCYPTTRFQWLPSYSGKDENKIVEDAGERACTICYPSAPVDVLSRPSKINDPEKEAARLEREAKKAAKDAATAAKAIANPDGTPLIVNGWKQKTVRAAEIATVSHMVDLEIGKTHPQYFPNTSYQEEKARDVERALVALAHKNGTNVEDERTRLNAKVAKKVKAWFK